MIDIVRDSFFGRCVYHLSKHKYCFYKEEREGYIIDEKYYRQDSSNDSLEKAEFCSSPKRNSVDSSGAPDEEVNGNVIVVDWDGPEDQDNPLNWSFLKRLFVCCVISLLTFTVYSSPAMYTPGVDGLRKEFNIGEVLSMLPVTMFVMGYGVGPLILCPLSENPYIGRTSVYIYSMFAFLLLVVGVADSKNIGSLCVLRFLAGFFGSPALTTGGATMVDCLGPVWFPIGNALWGIASFSGTSFGPLIGSVLVTVGKDWMGEDGSWRLAFWFHTMLTGLCFAIIIFLLPETYPDTILLRKAVRLRAITGNQNILSKSELEHKDKTLREMAIEILWRPIELSIIEPVVILTNLYIALVYALIYLMFESFPIIYLETYHFSLIGMGLAYISFIIGVCLGLVLYLPLAYKSYVVKMQNNEPISPETFIPSAIIGAVLATIGLFIFGWTVNPNVHWIGSLIGSAIIGASVIINFQSILNYLCMSFPRYLASVYASNDLLRSLCGGAFPLFGRYLYKNLSIKNFPVGWGSSVLGFIALAMISIPVFFYLYGIQLRARSKYAG